MTDDEFLTAFEDCTLPPSEWTHQAHVRAAWLYASRNTLDDAIDQIRRRIGAYNRATGTPETVHRGYHETITLAFMRLVGAAHQKTGPHQSALEFCDAHPDLLSKYVLQTYYSRERLMSPEAKAGYVEPDLRPLPVPIAGQPGDASTGRSEKTEIRALTGNNADQVSELAIRSKAFWGYPEEQMEVFRDELTMTPDELNSRIAYGLYDRTQLVGFYTIVTVDEHDAELEHLFVCPTRLRSGHGRTLLNHAISFCRSLNQHQLTLLSDPNATGFYVRCGAQFVEEMPSGIPGRTVSRYQIDLTSPTPESE